MNSKKEYDWLIVGSGMAGTVFAHEMTKMGYKCLIIDRRKNIGGNCYTEKRNGIPIHLWGAHIFHTNSKEVWDWINQFANFKKYKHSVKCNYKGKLYTFPINLKTLNEINSTINTPEQATEYFQECLNVFEKNNPDAKDNLETHCQKQIGKDLYEIFIKGYTTKQWGKDPKDLPSRIIKRIPVRTNLDDTYFHNAEYEGIPENGYTEIFENALKDIKVINEVDYLKDMNHWDSLAENVLYTGPLDEYFNWSEGELEWRSIEFIHKHLDKKDFQGLSVINYNEEEIPYTRIIEHKHFIPGLETPSTWITEEYPKEWKRGDEPFYPIADEKNNNIWKSYKEKFEQTGKFCAGRLADYKYYDMDQVIGSTLALVKKISNSNIPLKISKITNEWIKTTFEEISEEESNSETIHNIRIRKDRSHLEIFFVLDCDGYGKHECLVDIYYDGKIVVDFMETPIEGSGLESEFKKAIENYIKE